MEEKPAEPLEDLGKPSYSWLIVGALIAFASVIILFLGNSDVACPLFCFGFVILFAWGIYCDRKRAK